MAHTVTPQVLDGGEKFTVIKYTIKGDVGDATELVNYVLFDASAYGSKIADKLMDISYCLNGFSAELFWDATANVALKSLAKGEPYHENLFCAYGGLPNNAGTGVTGDILITTTGLASTTYSGYIILRMAWR